MVKSLLAFVSSVVWMGAASAEDIAGKWNVTAQSPSGRSLKLEMVLKQDGGKVSGTLGDERGTVDIQEGTIEGSELSFKLAVDGGYTVKLRLAGDELKGTSTESDGTVWQVAAARPVALEPASIAGRWKLNAKRPEGRESNVEIEIKEDAGKLSAAILAGDMSIPLEDVKLEGNELSFKRVTANGTYGVKMTVGKNSMKGTYSAPGDESGPVTATR